MRTSGFLVLLLALSVWLAGCTLLQQNRPSPPSQTPQPSATAVSPLAMPTAPSIWSVPNRNAPLLYLLAPNVAEASETNVLWQYVPAAEAPFSQVTTDPVTAAATDPKQGALAFGTTSGALYIAMAGAAPQLIWQSTADGDEHDAAFPPSINNLAWSPDGMQLAFAVRLDKSKPGLTNDKWVERTGLWLWQQATGAVTQIWQSQAWSPYSLYLVDTAWSPDGTQLAFTVTYDYTYHVTLADHVVEQVTGLWLWSAADDASTHLLDNHYFWGENVNETEVLQDLAWSPDGAALRIQATYWEWTNPVWLFPVVAGEENVHRPPVRFRGPDTFTAWRGAEWRVSSESLLLYGESHSLYSDIQAIDRRTASMQQIVDGVPDDGAAAGWAIIDLRETAQGLLFLGQPLGDGDPSPDAEAPPFSWTMAIGLYRLDVDAAIQGTEPIAVSHEPLCSNYLFTTAWQPTGDAVALLCDSALQIVLHDGTVLYRETALPTLVANSGTYNVRLLWAQ